MLVKKTMGRPDKVNYRIIMRLADAIAHNTNITDACRYAGISRDTYYHHLKGNPVFANEIATAKSKQNKVVMTFLTI